MNEILAVGIVAAAAISLRVVVRYVMDRVAVVAADETSRSHGFRDVLQKLRDRSSKL